MAKGKRILSNIREAIGTFLDIRDIIAIITSGGVGVVAVLHRIPIWAIVLLFMVFAFEVIRFVIKYQKWEKIKREKKEWLDIPLILEQMYNHLCEIAKKLADNGMVNDEKLSQALSLFVEALMVDKRLGDSLAYQLGLGAMVDKQLWHKLLYKRSRQKDLEQARLLMTFAFNKAGIEIKTDDQYDLLKTKLNDLTKTMNDDDIKRDIDDYLDSAYQVCTIQLADKYWFGDIEGIDILVDRYHSKIQKALSQKLFRLKKKIIKYWLKEG